MEKRTRVLIVDNDEQLLISLERLLEDEGIEAATTWSAQQGLELLLSIGFDVLLMGDHLPDLSCEQLLREIQRRGVPASILVMESEPASLTSSQSYFSSLGVTATVGRRDFAAILRSIRSFPGDRIGKQAGAA